METDICKAAQRCRVCGSTELRSVIDLGSQYIASIFATGDIPSYLDRAFPLEVVRCSDDSSCGLVQLRHSIDPRILYDHYGYRSGTNELMRENLRGIARQIQAVLGLQPGDRVLDIGCNDGTLLQSYGVDGLQLIGIDPSDAVKAIEGDDIEVINEFFSGDALEGIVPTGTVRAITSIAMFYDLEDPVGFAKDVAALLKEDGVWVLELSYLPSMLDTNSFDTICHEHLEYYSLAQLEWIAREAGLEVRRVELNEVNGGSIRAFLRHPGAPIDLDGEAALDEFRRKEGEMGLRSDVPYAAFEDRAEGIREGLNRTINDAIASGSEVYVYGASTKGNTLLQFCHLDGSKLTKAADRNPDKWGTCTLGTRIPIVSEEEARADRPGYFLVLPWHFLPGFLEREKEYLDSGGKFIVPLPEVRVVGADGVEAMT